MKVHAHRSRRAMLSWSLTVFALSVGTYSAVHAADAAVPWRRSLDRVGTLTTSLERRGPVGSVNIGSATLAARKGGSSSSTAAVAWTALVNATAGGDLLSKSAGCDGCADAGAASAQWIAGGDGYVEVPVTDVNAVRFIGLSHDNTGTTGGEIDFALRLQSGRVDVSENGTLRAGATVRSGDVLRIQVTGGKVRYLRNGKGLYSSAVAATYPLIVDTALYSSAASFSKVRLAGGTMPPEPPPPATAPPANQVVVSTTSEFRSAVSAAAPGTTILVNPGTYEGGSYNQGVSGTAEAPIVIQAADPMNPPVFLGGYTGMQLSDAQYVTLRDLVFQGPQENGINIDDGGTYDTPAHHITLSRIVVRDLPAGNRDGIKLSGVTDFLVENSLIERWGDGGSAVDLVGCHRGVIRTSVFRHTPGMEGGNGIEAKGGSTQVTISGNRFENAASRAVQIGGSTGLAYFRPQPPDTAEARDILVEHNVMVGGETAVAFVSSDGGVARDNTIYMPTRFLLRILQEQTAPGSVLTRNGVFSNNIVYWTGGLYVNIGAGTEPSTFTFTGNWWYRADAPYASQPGLPTVEVGGVYGVDPQFVAPPNDLRTTSSLPFGAYAN